MKPLDTILWDEYGVTIYDAPPCAILWAAESLPKELGKSELKRANELRDRIGKPIAIPAYGNKLFYHDGGW